MNEIRRRSLWRTVLLATALAGALACGDTSCDCVTPLEQPLPEESRIFDAAQMRLTPAAFDFLEDNLAGVLAMFLQDGLTFDVPPIHQEVDAWLFTLSIDVCDAGCTLQAEIVDATLTRVEPNALHLDGHIDLSGLVTMTGDVECDVPIHIQGKPISADILLVVDPRDDLLTFELAGASITVEDQDYTLDCSGLLGWLIEALKGMITDIMNQEIGGQLDSALDDMVADTTCLGCDYYTGGCPAGASCDDPHCLDDTDGTCRTNPLGLAGTLDLGSLLGDIAPGLEAGLDILLAAGQELDALADPPVVDDGVAIRLVGGAEATPHACVPAPPPEEVPPSTPPDRMPFPDGDILPSTGERFMAGIGVSDVFLDWFLYKAYLSGTLCLTIDTESSGGLLSSATLELLMGSLRELTGDRNAPVQLQLKPRHVPGIEIGEGTFTVDPQGNKIIDQPLLAIFLPGTDLDFYVRIDERWVKVVTTTQDLTLLLGLEFLPDNRLLPVFDENSIVIENVVARDYQLLAEDPEALENLVPTLIGLALPVLTESLGVIELPSIEGFVLDLLAVQPEVPRPDSPYHDYLGVYANLELATAPAPVPRATRARLLAVDTAPRGRMSIFAPGGPAYPQAFLLVGADPGPGAEFSWRLDGGGWSVFRTGPRLHVRSPLLALAGEHVVEVRARTRGDYRTLDPDPVVVPLVIDPADDGIRFDPPLPGEAGGPLGLATESASARTPADPQVGCSGCASAGGGGAAGCLLVLAPILARRGRRGRRG